MKNILFLCTGNSCRSIMAEGLMNHLGEYKYRAFSAGSFPTGKIHPMSLATLKKHGIRDYGYESKSWDQFTSQAALDIVITVCDNAAGETCPIFPGGPVKAHWGVPDPAQLKGSQAEIIAEFDRVFNILKKRMEALIILPETTDKSILEQKLNQIGKL